MVKVHSAYFIDFAAAIRYYRAYGFTERDVKRKIYMREIHIGEPDKKTLNYSFLTINDDVRYVLNYN